ncbi:Exosome RNA helicase MTR4 [Cichlidogyrus casuarinus]|uniref:Exosome RNA helicase MTR4 n=1 Tax=Cichlidogyrus casuarinus TaxID=1844966 RepID=A0ABD2Q732_9PLAT
MPDILSKKRKFESPKFSSKTIEKEGCLHQVVYRPDTELPSLSPTSTEPAKTYPFTLDSFQKQAILCIENKQSVLVSAHTSAGKTVVAEYAVATGLKNKQRVIYTTPIKALSNQKFREFTEEFKDVGLMTGDITINPDASVVIMTTEILRSILYRGSDLTREIGWVIFDEVHYMREKERGVVWEETIILIPDCVPMIFLSATIPNAHQFAEWIVHLHHRPCNIVYTDYRPTPLQHYVFPCGGNGIHLVVNQQREFLEENFNEAIEILRKNGDAAKSDMKLLGKKGGSQMAMSYCSKLVKLVMDQQLDPLIIFSFSKRECERNAEFQRNLDFTDEKEKAAIDLIFENAISSLSDEDKKLPQVAHMHSMVRNGVGCHHGGLLPILKEVVEILFGESYIKILCATETFAMGLNMPARTVLFTSTTKFDGVTSRLISPGEYIQMSGRAGRRGKDDRGTVIMMLDDRITSQAAKNLLCGSADPLNSAFYLTYTMVLNLMLVEDLNPESMLERSFFQFQNYRRLPDLEKNVKKIKEEIDLLALPVTVDKASVDLDQLANYVDLLEAAKVLEKEKWSIVQKNQNAIKFLQSGRLIQVERPEDGVDFGWGIVVGLRSLKSGDGESVTIVDCLLRVAAMHTEQKELKDNLAPSQLDVKNSISIHMADPWSDEPLDSSPEEVGPGSKSSVVKWTCKVCQLPMSAVYAISNVCVHLDQMVSQHKSGNSKSAGNNVNAKSLRIRSEPHRVRVHLWQSISRVVKKCQTTVPPCLDPIVDMKIKDRNLISLSERIHMLRERLKTNPISQRVDLERLIDFYTTKSRKCEELEQAVDNVKNCESLLQMDELRARKRVLRRLGFCSEPDESITLKGRIACELSTGHELLLTELLLDGMFSNLSAEQCAAVLCCFVSEATEVRGSKVQLGPDLEKCLVRIKEKARFISRISSECRVGAANFQTMLKHRQSTSSLLEVDQSKNAPVTPKEKDHRLSNPFAANSNSGSTSEMPKSLASNTAIDIDENNYADRFSGELMEVVRAWALGASFKKCTEMTTVFDGTIIRVMRRLEELLRQMHCAAKVAGDTDMENKFAKAIVLIKRDIIFAASLYL